MNVQFFSFTFFVRPAALTLWNRWKDAVRKCKKIIQIGNFPASRPGASAGRHRGRRRRAGSRARWPGRSGGSNRTGSGRQAPWCMGRHTGWPTGGGGPENGKGGAIPHGPPLDSSFASFRGASAGLGRRTSGVDGADIGRGNDRVKEYYRKKEILLKDQPGGAHLMGGAGRQGWKGTQDCVARCKLFPGGCSQRNLRLGTPSGIRRRRPPPRRRRAGPPGWR